MSRPESSMEEEFLSAYDLYADAIFRHCAFRIGDRQRGRDFMQETFLRTWEYLRKGNTAQNMKALLYRIANNLIIDTYRRDSLRKEESLENLRDDSGFDPPDPAQSPMRDMEGSQVIETIDAIPEPYRTAIVMRYIDGLSPKDIGELLNVSANVVSVRIHRGVEHLKSILSPTDPSHG